MCEEQFFSVGDDEIAQGLFFYFYFQRNIRLSVHLGRHPVFPAFAEGEPETFIRDFRYFLIG